MGLLTSLFTPQREGKEAAHLIEKRRKKKKEKEKKNFGKESHRDHLRRSVISFAIPSQEKDDAFFASVSFDPSFLLIIVLFKIW